MVGVGGDECGKRPVPERVVLRPEEEAVMVVELTGRKKKGFFPNIILTAFAEKIFFLLSNFLEKSKKITVNKHPINKNQNINNKFILRNF